MAALAVLLAACDTGRSVEQTATVAECERCHGYPPPPYITAGGANHPSDLRCSLCHPGTVAADNVTIIPGGQHMDGIVEAGHDMPFVAQHAPVALANIAGCKGCHGADYGGGIVQTSCNTCHAANFAESAPDWKTNCTFCHGTRTADVTTATAKAAPPQAVVSGGDQTRTNPKVGAHQKHLTAGAFAPALPCASCHAVPDAAAALTHFQGNGTPGAITFSATAVKGVTNASYTGGTCAVYCHGSGTQLAMPAGKVSPAWTATGIACGECHALPPSSGPSIGNPLQPAHPFHLAQGAACADCHDGYTGASVNLARHVNGTKDVIVQASGGGTATINGWDCKGCHTAKGVPLASHPMPYIADHTTAALQGIAACTGCHGADYGGELAAGVFAPSCNACHLALVPASAADWKSNCTFCHGTRTPNVTAASNLVAPPQAVVSGGDQTRTNPKVGAHQAHVTQGPAANAMACTTCHFNAVPDAAGALSHFSGGDAAVAFDALSRTGAANAAYAGAGGTCSVYCHGSGTSWPTGSLATAVAWTATGVTCSTCHGTPPATGPTVSGAPAHVFHVSNRGQACSRCHDGYTATSVNRASHPDGVRDVVVTPTAGGSQRITGWNCSACHTALGV